MIFTTCTYTFTFAQNLQKHTSSLCFILCVLFRSITDFILYVMLCDNQLRMVSSIQLREMSWSEWASKRARDREKSESAGIVSFVHSFTDLFHMVSRFRAKAFGFGQLTDEQCKPYLTLRRHLASKYTECELSNISLLIEQRVLVFSLSCWSRVDKLKV